MLRLELFRTGNQPFWEVLATVSTSAEFVERHFDRTWMVETLSHLAKVPTDIPLGFNTLMEPDDPKLVHYVQHVLRSELVHLGVFDLLDVPRNNLVAQLGTGASGRTLLIQNYTPSQHHNLMRDPFSGKVASAREFGVHGPAVFGRGVSQNKAHQTAMLVALRMIRDSGVPIRGRLYWAINNEGRSSHDCSTAIINALDEKPEFCVIQSGTHLKLSLGNRGRVDIDVHVKGSSAHSSSPEHGLSAIDGAHEVVNRLKSLAWSDTHPILGGRHGIVYKIDYFPVAPHTIPSDAWLTVDRRLLPGDDVDAAVEEVRDAIGDLSPYEVHVERGVCMLPALVEPDHQGVRSLQAANVAIRGHQAETVYRQGTFDAGGPCSMGVPAVMFGARGGAGITGDDFISIADVETEAKVLATMIFEQLS